MQQRSQASCQEPISRRKPEEGVRTLSAGDPGPLHHLIIINVHQGRTTAGLTRTCNVLHVSQSIKQYWRSSIPMFHNAKRKPTTGHDSESPTCSCHPQRLLPYGPCLSSHYRSPSSKLFYSRFPTKTTMHSLTFPSCICIVTSQISLPSQHYVVMQQAHLTSHDTYIQIIP